MSFVLVQVIVGGLLLGAVYALFSSGLTLVWGGRKRRYEVPRVFAARIRNLNTRDQPNHSSEPGCAGQKGPTHVVKRGKTPVLSVEDARALLA